MWPLGAGHAYNALHKKQPRLNERVKRRNTSPAEALTARIRERALILEILAIHSGRLVTLEGI